MENLSLMLAPLFSSKLLIVLFFGTLFGLILGVLFYSIVGSIVAVVVERPKFKWLDDDLLMQIFPIMVLTIFYFSGIGPEISLTLETN